MEAALSSEAMDEIAEALQLFSQLSESQQVEFYEWARRALLDQQPAPAEHSMEDSKVGRGVISLPAELC